MSMQVNNDGDNKAYSGLKAGAKIEVLKNDVSNWEIYGPLFEAVDRAGEQKGVVEESEIDLLKTLKVVLSSVTSESIKEFITEWKNSGSDIKSFIYQKFIIHTLEETAKANEQIQKEIEQAESDSTASYIIEQLRKSGEERIAFEEKLKALEEQNKTEE